MIANNVPDYLQIGQHAATTTGFFTRTPPARAATRSRSSTTSTATSAARSGAARSWGFYSYRLNDQYRYTTGSAEQHRAVEADQPLHLQAHLSRSSQNNQLIGFINKRQKLQDKRGISLTTPLSAAYYQSSQNTPMKAEWTSVLGSRAFLDVHGRQLVELLPAAPGPRLRPLRRPVGPGSHRTWPTARSSTAAPTTATRTRSAGSRRAT